MHDILRCYYLLLPLFQHSPCGLKQRGLKDLFPAVGVKSLRPVA